MLDAALVTRLTVAAAQYPVEALADWQAYAAKLTRWLEGAAEAGASLAVFPEYGAMELASLDPASMGDLQGSIAFVSALLPRVDALHAELADRLGLHVLAASAPIRMDDGTWRNRARLFAPGGKVGVQDKLIMTRFEREQWHIAAGSELTLFETALGRIGICICYDCEFPLIARRLVEAGAELILVPSCTDSVQGYHRVAIGARARALEGQCYTVQAPTVGAAPWSPAIDINVGQAGVFAPPDLDFPGDGTLALGAMDAPQWLFAELDMAAIATVRSEGAVFNYAHWPEQAGGGEKLPRAAVQSLL